MVWESQYFCTVFILTRMEIGTVHGVQLALEGGEDLLCLTHPSPGLGGVRHLHTETWGVRVWATWNPEIFLL